MTKTPDQQKEKYIFDYKLNRRVSSFNKIWGSIYELLFISKISKAHVFLNKISKKICSYFNIFDYEEKVVDILIFIFISHIYISLVFGITEITYFQIPYIFSEPNSMAVTPPTEAQALAGCVRAKT